MIITTYRWSANRLQIALERFPEGEEASPVATALWAVASARYPLSARIISIPRGTRLPELSVRTGRRPVATEFEVPLSTQKTPILNQLQPGLYLHRREFERSLPMPRARKLAENFPADAFRADRTLPRGVQDRCAHRVTAQTIRVLLSCGRADASNPPAKTSTEEILPRCLAIRPRRFPLADSATRNHHALVRVQWPQSCREHVRR